MPDYWEISNNSLYLHYKQSCNYYKHDSITNMTTYERLLSHHIKPSVQRMAILDYLDNHRTHPTVDEIYMSLSPDMPTLSKTTVYNTLKLFAEQGAATMLTIDEKNACFDSDLTPHGHFLCKKCGKIFDIPYPVVSDGMEGSCMEGFDVKEMHFYCKGICKSCKEKL